MTAPVAAPVRTTAAHWIRAISAGTRAMLCTTTQEARCLELAEDVAESLGWPVHTWTAASGVDGSGLPLPLLELLTARLRGASNELWVLFDPVASLRGPGEVRALRELAQRAHGPALLLVDPRPILPTGPLVQRVPELLVVDLPPLPLDEVAAAVRWAGHALEQGAYPGAAEAFDAGADAIARAAIGLHGITLDHLLAEAVLDVGVDADAVVDFIRRAKPSLVDAQRWLEPIDPVPHQELGGLASYKTWLQRRALALDPSAAAAGIRTPRGVLLCGVQGCGKSLAARATADVLHLPLLRLEPGRIFGGTVGQSEANVREILATADTMAPIVLWLDEVEKGFAGADGARSDAGTAARVMGTLLTWLQERRSAVFVVATANRVDQLPPELLRRGRLDEIFFVDLPDAATRAEIIGVHLERTPSRTLGVAPPLADPPQAYYAVAAAADGFSGAELESALVEARLEAFAEHRPVGAEDLRRAIAATVPLSVARKESVGALRAWAQHRARPADTLR